MRPFTRFLLISIASVFVLLLAIHTGANIVEGRSLERALADLRARGEPLTLTEIAPPRVPDERNAALVYQRAFRLRLKGNGEADQLIADFTSENPERRKRVTIGQVRDVLAKAAPALALVRQAAAMPECRFPVNYEAGAGATFPHLASIRDIARLLSARSVIETMDGRSSDALADIGAIFDISRQVSIEPVLVGQLVQYACIDIAERALRRSMALAAPDATASVEMYRKLAAYDVDGPFARAMEGERCFGLWAFNLVKNDPNGAAALMIASNEAPSSPPSNGLSRSLAALAGPVLKKDEIYYLNAMQSAIDQSRKRRPSTEAGVTKMSPDAIPRYAVITRIMLPSFTRVEQKRDEAAARLGLAEWALALNLIRQRTGRRPSSLAEARKLTGWAFPNDPFTGRPFVFRAQPGGFLLYSVGANGKDDGGEGWQDYPPEARRTERDDVVWRVPEAVPPQSPEPPFPLRAGE